MSVSLVCPSCGKVLRVDEGLLGKQVRCGSCKQVFTAADSPDEAWDEPPILTAELAHKDHGGKAIASFVLGILGLLGWCLPIIGLPMTITGLVLGIKGLKSRNQGLAIAGIV